MPNKSVTEQAHHNPLSPAAPAAGKRLSASKKASAGLLFLTVNTFRRLHVFREPEACEIFFRELDFYRARFGFELYGYVLMPDHFHLLLHFPPDRVFGSFLRDFKSAVGRRVIDWAKENRRMGLLNRLKLAQTARRNRDSRFAVLQANSYVVRVTSASMFKKKLNYIHENPLREKLVARAIDFLYSSLRNYERGEGSVQIDWHGMILP